MSNQLTPTNETFSTGAVREKMYPKDTKFSIRIDLLFQNTVALRRLGETYGEGEAKYGAGNWMKGFPESVYLAHMQEHIRMYMTGDTSEDHLAHATWNILSLMWVQERLPHLMDLQKDSLPSNESSSNPTL